MESGETNRRVATLRVGRSLTFLFHRASVSETPPGRKALKFPHAFYPALSKTPLNNNNFLPGPRFTLTRPGPVLVGHHERLPRLAVGARAVRWAGCQRVTSTGWLASLLEDTQIIKEGRGI